MANIYFELTEIFNREEPTVALASGQAVVYYRIAMMSKDGDWVIRESPAACERVLNELARRGAKYRPGAPLDIRWLAGGWSSHFEFVDTARRRIRCDFISRPPRVPESAIDALFAAGGDRLIAVDVETLISMKQTQRAKDYPVIGELATLLPPAREIERTTNADRIVALAPSWGRESRRPAVQAALSGGRRDVVLALAAEADDLQQKDRARVDAYARAARRYLHECRSAAIDRLPLAAGHARLCELAEQWLPQDVSGSNDHGDAQ